MSTKNIKDGQERFDGFAVTQYEGRFGGSFDLDEDLAKDVAFDDQVTFVVTGRVSGVAFAENKLGDIRRVNTFQVTQAIELDPSVAATVLKGAPIPGQIKGQTTIHDALDDTKTVVNNVVVAPAAPQGIPVDDPVLAGFLREG